MSRFKLTRQAFRPRGYENMCRWSPKDSDAEIWTFSWIGKDGDRRFGLTAFGGKRTKPDVHMSFKSLNSRDTAGQQYADQQAKNKILADERKATRKKPHSLSVGDLLYSSWGYDQTNVDFYEVVALHGKTMVSIEAIGSQYVDNTGPAALREFVIPNPDIRTGKITRHRPSALNVIRLNSYSAAYPTDATTPHYQTPWGYGH